MIALIASLLLQAAPSVRTDGVWYPTKVAALVVRGAAGDLDLASGVTFGAAEVTIGYGMEDETRSWRANEEGLEVRSGEVWRPLQWKETKPGVVKTDIKRAGELEELTFVAGTGEQHRKIRAEKLKTSLLTRLAGKWSGGGHALELQAAESTFDGKPTPLRAMGCTLHCESKPGTLCASIGPPEDARLFLPQGKKLVEVAIEGSCGEEAPGVELVPEGLVLEKK